jgi:hypothetical protein
MKSNATNSARNTRERRRAAADPQAYTFTIPDAQAMGGPGRTMIYSLAKQGKLRLVKVGGRTMVDGASLRALLGAAA